MLEAGHVLRMPVASSVVLCDYGVEHVPVALELAFLSDDKASIQCRNPERRAIGGFWCRWTACSRYGKELALACCRAQAAGVGHVLLG